MATSGTYNYQNLSLDTIIEEAYERIGIGGEKLVPNLLSAAKRSIDLILLSWMSQSVNLWTLQTNFLPLVQNQGSYPLDNTVNDLVQVSLRTSFRVLGGVASSSSGVAANAFDGNAATSCTQTAPNGSITYTYPAAQTINFVGITSFTTQTYSLQIGCQSGGVDSLLLAIPPQQFPAQTTLWFDLPFFSSNATVYYVQETGGATLDMAEIYFNNNVTDTPMSNISRYTYYTYPQKSTSGRPGVYYLDKQANPSVPSLYIWPTPSSFYANSVLFYTYKKMMADSGSFLDSPSVPALFYPALIAQLAYALSVKYKPEIAEALRLDAAEAFALAQSEDSESTAIRIIPNWSNR